MRHFPIFLDLSGRRCLVIGGGEAAVAKAEALARAGARVAVVAALPCRGLLAAFRRGDAAHLATRFEPAQLEGAALVFVAGKSLALNERVATAAEARGIPVNVMDEPRLCSFIMPAVVERAPVQVAIATGGAAPMLARQLRFWLDRLLPERLGALAVLAGRFRPLVRRRLGDPAARRRFWEMTLAGEPARLALGGDDAAAGAALRAALDHAPSAGDPARAA